MREIKRRKSNALETYQMTVYFRFLPFCSFADNSQFTCGELPTARGNKRWSEKWEPWVMWVTAIPANSTWTWELNASLNEGKPRNYLLNTFHARHRKNEKKTARLIKQNQFWLFAQRRPFAYPIEKEEKNSHETQYTPTQFFNLAIFAFS